MNNEYGKDQFSKSRCKQAFNAQFQGMNMKKDSRNIL